MKTMARVAGLELTDDGTFREIPAAERAPATAR
jgi:hypothetical protein